MADDPHSNLADGWEAVESEDGRGHYWWNVNSNETTWEKPVAIVAKKSIAAGYLAKVQSQDGAAKRPDARQSAPKSAAAAELAALREQKRGAADGGVSDASWRVGNMAIASGAGPAAEAAPATPTPKPPDSSSPGSLRSKALSAEQMKKFAEAKAAMAAKSESMDAPPAKVDLYK